MSNDRNNGNKADDGLLEESEGRGFSKTGSDDSDGTLRKLDREEPWPEPPDDDK